MSLTTRLLPAGNALWAACGLSDYDAADAVVWFDDNPAPTAVVPLAGFLLDPAAVPNLASTPFRASIPVASMSIALGLPGAPGGARNAAYQVFQSVAAAGPTATKTNSHITCNTGASDVNLTQPAPGAVGGPIDGDKLCLVRIPAAVNKVTFTPSGCTINGAASYTALQGVTTLGQTAEFQFDGASNDWKLISVGTTLPQ